ncbi:MAG: DinB family protein [Sphingobacteriales bacterium]|nr:MAG: DinB family protein [Sphingobacteriales bacterium]
MNINELTSQIKRVYNGDPWYGNNVKVVLNELTAEQADWHAHPGANSIAQIIKHMISWRQFTIGRVKNNDSRDVEMNSAEDWDKNLKVENASGLQALIAQLDASQQALIEALENKDDAYLETMVTGRNYNMRYLVQGISEHDIYHLGQIGYVLALWKKGNS